MSTAPTAPALTARRSVRKWIGTVCLRQCTGTAWRGYGRALKSRRLVSESKYDTPLRPKIIAPTVVIRKQAKRTEYSTGSSLRAIPCLKDQSNVHSACSEVFNFGNTRHTRLICVMHYDNTAHCCISSRHAVPVVIRSTSSTATCCSALLSNF
jgi:hypothetical protein